MYQVEKGETSVKLTNDYGAGQATIHNMRKNRDKAVYFFKTMRIQKVLEKHPT